MNNIQEIFLVHYWVYGDTETMHTLAFTNQEDADKYQKLIWDKCEQLNIPVEVTANNCIPTLEYAIKELDEHLTECEDE